MQYIMHVHEFGVLYREQALIGKAVAYLAISNHTAKVSPQRIQNALINLYHNVFCYLNLCILQYAASCALVCTHTYVHM